MNKVALSPGNLHLIKKLAIGGAALGGGTALATQLINWLSSARQDAKEIESRDDDVLYVNLPTARKQADAIEQLVAPGAAVVGGLGAGMGVWALVRAISQKAKQEEAKKRLEKSQNLYLQTIQGEAAADKMATAAPAADGRAPSGGEMAYAGVSALPILMALASGALSYQALNKYFPAPTRKTQTQPRRIVFRRQDPEGPVKEANMDMTEADLESSAACGIRTALEFLKLSKRASDLPDIVAAAALGQSEEMVRYLTSGADPQLLGDMVKGASYTTITPVQETLAITLLTKHAGLQLPVSILASAEILDHIPNLVAMGQYDNDFNGPVWMKAASVFENSIRYDVLEPLFGEGDDVKEASVIHYGDLEGVLAELR